MNIPRVRLNSHNRNNNCQGQRVQCFTATPGEILCVLENAKLCPGKKGFLTNIATFFAKVQEQLRQFAESPKQFVYKLGQKNELPEQVARLQIGDCTVAQMDEILNGGGFKCSPTSTCACGLGKNKGEYLKTLLQMLGVKDPDVITL